MGAYFIAQPHILSICFLDDSPPLKIYYFLSIILTFFHIFVKRLVIIYSPILHKNATAFFIILFFLGIFYLVEKTY